MFIMNMYIVEACLICLHVSEGFGASSAVNSVVEASLLRRLLQI